ncbi:hypothetical protein SUDANB105_05266 [Streptomyces sp. enrichment culture]|uniref:hypothetical protein n=1 Tax=Streptomyces sp. enrichment culture TaxID=1795815 RepID=UPI003F54459A
MNVTEEDLRFAELAARTGLETRTGGRLDADLDALLAQFEPAGGESVRVENLTAADVTEAGWCIFAGDLTQAGA